MLFSPLFLSSVHFTAGVVFIRSALPYGSFFSSRSCISPLHSNCPWLPLLLVPVLDLSRYAAPSTSAPSFLPCPWRLALPFFPSALLQHSRYRGAWVPPALSPLGPVFCFCSFLQLPSLSSPLALDPRTGLSGSLPLLFHAPRCAPLFHRGLLCHLLLFPTFLLWRALHARFFSYAACVFPVGSCFSRCPRLFPLFRSSRLTLWSFFRLSCLLFRSATGHLVPLLLPPWSFPRVQVRVFLCVAVAPFLAAALLTGFGSPLALRFCPYLHGRCWVVVSSLGSNWCSSFLFTFCWCGFPVPSW